MGVRVDSFSALNLIPAEACVAFNEIIPQATSHFDFSEQKLVMSFPQAAMQQVARGTVPESRWDDGVPALLLDYSFSGSNSSHDTKVIIATLMKMVIITRLKTKLARLTIATT